MAGGGQTVSGRTGDDKRWQGVIYSTLHWRREVDSAGKRLKRRQEMG
jgi:hypothetical protein